MSYVTIAHPPVTLDQIGEMFAESERPSGLLDRYAGLLEGQPTVVAVWQSKDHADRFFSDVIGPALAKKAGPGALPKVTALEVAYT
jgi:hypothetical protein